MKSSRLGDSGTERIVLGDKEWPLTTKTRVKTSTQGVKMTLTSTEKDPF